MKYTVNARCVDFNIDHSIFRLTSSANVYWKIVTQNFNSFNIAWHRISSSILTMNVAVVELDVYSKWCFLKRFVSASKSELGEIYLIYRWYSKGMNFLFSIPTWISLHVLCHCQFQRLEMKPCTALRMDRNDDPEKLCKQATKNRIISMNNKNKSILDTYTADKLSKRSRIKLKTM